MKEGCSNQIEHWILQYDFDFKIDFNWIDHWILQYDFDLKININFYNVMLYKNKESVSYDSVLLRSSLLADILLDLFVLLRSWRFALHQDQIAVP